MQDTCLFCHQSIPRNEALEWFPVGRRVAYDAARGRLWAVCPHCARWTLAPIEARWEALEELERLTRDRARLLGSTDSIALLAAADIEVVRIGKATLREESWWRYGREFAARSRLASRLTRHGKVLQAVVTLAVAGIPWWGSGQWWVDRARRRRFGRHAWPVASNCDRCGTTIDGLRFDDDLRLHMDAAGEPVGLRYRCAHCRSDAAGAGHRLTGVAADHALRRYLAYRNYSGAPEPDVRSAMELVESYPSTGALVDSLATADVRIDRLTDRGALALEIAVNEDVERRLLRMELADLQARWREEERIAAIADSL